MARSRLFVRIFRSRLVIAILLIAVLLVGIRLALPAVVAHYVNRTLDQMPGYDGHIEAVDIHLWRGAYAIHGLEIVKVEKARGDIRRIPVFTAETLDLSVEWGALMRRTLVGQVEIYRPSVNIFAGPAKQEEARDLDEFIERIRELTPLRIDRLAVIDGEMHFRNYTAEPNVDIYLRDIDLVVRNLTNSARVSETLAATLSGTGQAMRSGRFNIEMRFNPLESRPTYELAFELKELKLPELNSYLRYYLGVIARDGQFSLSAESVAREGWFRGYVKPVVKELDILKIKQDTKSVGETIKAFFVKIMAQIFENKAAEQLATKIEFSGRFEDPEISIWEAVVRFLRNAFVEALQPGLEGSVSPTQAGKPSPGNPREVKEQEKTRQERRKLEDK